MEKSILDTIDEINRNHNFIGGVLELVRYAASRDDLERINKYAVCEVLGRASDALDETAGVIDQYYEDWREKQGFQRLGKE